MSAESFQTPKPGETVLPNGFILPPERNSNVRDEPIQFKNLGERSTKYNSPGVDPSNPYNAFARSSEIKANQNTAEVEAQPQSPERTAEAHNEVLENLVTELKAERELSEKLQARVGALEQRLASQPEAKKELAEKQPRRVRSENGVTERLVKYKDGSFTWEAISEESKAESLKQSASVTGKKDEAGQPSVAKEDLPKDFTLLDEKEESGPSSKGSPAAKESISTEEPYKILPVIPGKEGSEVPAKEGQSLEEYEAEHAPEVLGIDKASQLDGLFDFEPRDKTLASEKETTQKEKQSIRARMLKGFLAGPEAVKKLWESRPLRRRREAGGTSEEKEKIGRRIWTRVGVGTAALLLVAGLSGDSSEQAEQPSKPDKVVEMVTPVPQDDILDGNVIFGQLQNEEGER